MKSLKNEQDLLRKVRSLWERLADVPGCFDASVPIRVVKSPTSRLCPPGWVGIVRVGQATLITIPDESLSSLLADACEGLAIETLTDELSRRLPIVDVLGPACLAYLDEDNFRPQSSWLPSTAEREDLQRLLARASEDDASESGLSGITSPAFVVRQDGEVVAAAGYSDWLGVAAHMSVLTIEPQRRNGLGRSVASAATKHALERGLLPQWRARPVASRLLAQSLGYREVGSQLSIRLS